MPFSPKQDTQEVKAVRRIPGKTTEGWQRIVGALLMEETFYAANLDSICILAEMIISDSCIARFERSVSFETGTSLQNPALGWELGVPDKLAILSSFLGLTDLFEEMM
ncbi:hypothetical protein POTOM_011020 [Populus tomentosa]|uniref:Uncharacterized protein n=1 Tax=Populus tomentosa TaxID=118781 RepID=A0A8X8AQZ7_POPTO|nr:hypothetical protein POTOM_011020 [Populus tomentosa]